MTFGVNNDGKGFINFYNHFLGKTEKSDTKVTVPVGSPSKTEEVKEYSFYPGLDLSTKGDGKVAENAKASMSTPIETMNTIALHNREIDEQLAPYISKQYAQVSPSTLNGVQEFMDNMLELT